MILGILSDTHGQAARTRRALDLLLHNGTRAVVHCGDVGGDDVFAELASVAAQLDPAAAIDSAGRVAPIWFVWGNTDLVSVSAVRFVESLDLPLPASVPLVLRISGRRLAVFHGHEQEFQGFDARAVDYVLHGHTHVPRDQHIDSTRYVNPGALHRASRYTVATLDLARDRLTHWTLDDRPGRTGRPGA